MAAPDQVTGLVVPNRGNGLVNLSWTAPGDGGSPITDYLVEFDDGSGWATFVDGVSTATTATVTGLVNGTPVDFRVSAINLDGTGTASDTVTGTPAVPPFNDNFVDAASVNLLAGTYIDPNYSGTIAVTGMASANLEAGEPVTAVSGFGTLWYAVTGSLDGPGYLTLSMPVTDNARAEVFGGETLESLGLLGTASSSTTDPDVILTDAFVPPGVFYIRMCSPTGQDDTVVSWIYRARLPELVIVIANQLDKTPGALTVTVTNVEADAFITFSSPSHADFFEVQADSTGSAYNITVPIEWELAPGDYPLTATTTTQSGTADFTVLAVEDLRPTVPGAGTAPTPIVDAGVQKWRVVDPYTDVFWAFPFNPSEASTPHTPKVYTFKTTTAPDGQVLTWEGAPAAVAWTVSGYSNTQAFYEKLEALTASNKRYWLIDHRLRIWYVSFEDFDPEVKKDVSNLNWSFEYKLTINIYFGPVVGE